ncbi:MAG TPA: 1,2-phenylacetyl-CoA epoxidase subunit PaaD [Candidatus Dormibacteraeota bacterium]|jgi:ring-1,2-phenylacetyl-CoA epoxidase subunit PaaD|nr:1,2-phenylacetyl-CoA epoxidase subunit PaaD [Candidatus Dormibacteraeota bacterium]
MDRAERVRALVADVPDPEIPALTIEDLGILSAVREDGDTLVVEITPTYSGCPALEAIREDVERRLRDHGHTGVEVRTVLAPAWTTDRITERGRRRLAETGIAPPPPPHEHPTGVPCPQCGEPDTELLSRFAATPCQALRRCGACREPFAHLRAHR